MASKGGLQAYEDEKLLLSLPKEKGTTWLKALTFSILNRKRFSSSDNHPLLTSNSHELVPFLDFIFHGDNIQHKLSYLSNMTEPRLFGTHIPFPSLSNSIKESNCKIVYICRNPFDTFVSYWIFANKINPDSLHKLTMEEALEN
ncbi:hypothetical protein V8G54_024367 [Vigna mungo]|uniref:Sulfotransferase n=1 Tax=Vigna mungo TaxID=3915 RepID=A0AAQ3N748_VIGMU